MGRYKQQIAETFCKDGERQDGDWYVEGVLTAWREATTQLRRTSLLLIFSLLGFSLLASDHIRQVGIGSLTLQHLAPLVKLGPVVIAFLYLDLVLQFFSTYEYSELYADVSSCVRRELNRQKLDVPLAPTLGAMWGGQSILSAGAGQDASWFTKGVDVLNGLCGAAFLLAPLGVLGWAFVAILFQRFGADDPVVWFSLAASVICVLRALGIAAAWFEARKSYHDRTARDIRARSRNRSA